MALIAHWPLNGDTKDYSGFGNDGTISGNVTFGAGKIGEAFVTNTSTGKVVTNILDNELPDTFSIAGWVKIKEWGLSQGVFGTRLSPNGFMLYRNPGDSSGLLRTYLHYTNGSGTTTTTSHSYSGFELNKWHHFVVIRGNGFYKTYIDGVLRGNTTLSSFTSWNKGTSNFSIGSGGPSYTTSQMDLNDIRLYDHELTDSEIQQLTKAKILHYTFDDPYEEPTINICYDLALNYYDKSRFHSNDGDGFSEVLIGNKKWLQYNSGNRRLASLPISANTTYTWSLKIISPADSSISFYEWDSGGSYGARSYSITEGYNEVSHTFTSRAGSTSEILHLGAFPVGSKLADFQLEAKDHSTPTTNGTRDIGVNDISGYKHTGSLSVISNSPKWVSDSKVGGGSIYFNGTNPHIISGLTNLGGLTTVTISFWRKNDTTITHWLPFVGQTTSHYIMATSSGTGGFYHTAIGSSWEIFKDGVAQGPLVAATPFTDQEWHHYVIRGVDLSAWTQFRINGYTGVWDNEGYFDDIRIYNTNLSDKDIKDLYEVRAEILNSGTLLTYDFKQRRNLLQSVNQAIKDKQFKDGLSSHTQANTKVTLTDSGYRIYRTPNVNPTDNGNTMWGGLRIDMTQIPGGIPLTKGRSYRLIINTNGKTSNSSNGSSKFSNQMGWGGGGLVPTPITIGREWVQIPNNFNGKHDIIWEFKIEDDIYKVCTTSYSSFVAGNTYPSYRHLQLGWSYQDTGSEGTEIYITGIHLYDITDDDSIGISDKGIGTFDEYSTVGITDGLVGYWPLDKDLRDFSGNNYTAINYGGIFDSESTYFNGSSYITLPYGDNINPSTNPQSFSMMVKKTASTDTIFFTTSQSGNASARMYIRSGTNDGLNLAIQANSTNGTEYANSLSLNNWHYIVVTMDGSNAKLYLDGSLLNTKTYTSYLFNQDIRVGQHDGSYRFTGNIKNIKIFNRALTAEEIAIEYNTMFNNEVQIHESGVLYAKDLRQY